MIIPALRRLSAALAVAAGMQAHPIGAIAADVYSWSPNVVVAPPAGDRQQGETALATDAAGQIWLAFIDAQYHRLATGVWLDWPRSVRLFVSADRGRTFSAKPNLGDLAGDQALAADSSKRVFATYVQYFYPADGRSRQQIALRRLDVEQPVTANCLLWDDATSHDQSSLNIGADGSLHLVGVDIGSKKDRGALLYARSDDGRNCVQSRRLASIGELPQVVETTKALLIVGPDGFYASQDRGATFSERRALSFGQKLVRIAVSPDRKRIYVVGDALGGGPQFSVSEDGGQTWSVKRIAGAARAARYPAIHVSERGRVHIVWMDDRTGSGALYHAYSDDSGAHFSPETKITDAPFAFPADAPPPAPATQNGTWIGDYLAITTIGEEAVAAWSDQRLGAPNSVVCTSVGRPK